MRQRKDIAAEIGRSKGLISQWLNGKANISRFTAARLVEVYGRDQAFWMFGDLEEIRCALQFSVPIQRAANE